MSEAVVKHSAFEAALEALGPAAMTVVDVGARWGAAAAWFRLDPLARLVGFEPDVEECRRLNEQANPERERFYPVALGNRDGPATLHVTREPACSSLYPPSPSMLDRYPSLRRNMTTDRTLTVPVARLESWAATAGVEQIDFLKLDTQGSELDILAGAGALLDGCLGIEAEVMFAPLYEGQPLFAKVDSFLRARGFTLWRLDSLAHYQAEPTALLRRTGTVHFGSNTVTHAAGDGRLIWANALYFRDLDGHRVDPRSLYLLAALLEAAGDGDGCRRCLSRLGVTLAPENKVDEREAVLQALGLPEPAVRRIRITLGGQDCHPIPKVPTAGQVMEQDGAWVQIMHNGVKVLADGYCGRWMTELIRLLRGHHEPQEEWAFAQLLPRLGPGATMLELGSYWAYYSLWFLSAVPEGRAVLIEPDPGHLTVGLRNFELNQARGEFQQATLGRVYLPPRPFLCESDGQTRMVPEVSVDVLQRDLGLARIDLLLADIQGAELEMLQGAVACLERNLLRFLVLSTHHHAICGDPLMHERCLEFVQRHGGHVLIEHSVAESFSGDGLIVASFDPDDREMPPITVSHNRASTGLFRAPEHDLAETWQAIEALEAALSPSAAGDPRLADALGALREKVPALSRRRGASAAPEMS